MRAREDLTARHPDERTPPSPEPMAYDRPIGPRPRLEWATMAGKCQNGAERDSGILAHLVTHYGGLCGKKTSSFRSVIEGYSYGAAWPSWARQCPDCLRFLPRKVECPKCGRFVLKTKTGPLRAHRCYKPMQPQPHPHCRSNS